MSSIRLKNGIIALSVLSVLAFSTNTFAQTKSNGAKGNTGKTTLQHGQRFVDANGDGICDNAKDTNGDGIADGRGKNGTRPMDGTGKKHKMGASNGQGLKGGGNGSGTGICDGTGSKGNAAKK